MKISLSKIARIKTLKSPFPLECPKSFKLLKQFRQAKSQVLKQQRSLRTLVNFDFGHLLILLALRTLDKDFIHTGFWSKYHR